MEEELLTIDLLDTKAGITTLAFILAPGLKNKSKLYAFVDKENFIRVLASDYVINLLELDETVALGILSQLGSNRDQLVEYLKAREEFLSPEE